MDTKAGLSLLLFTYEKAPFSHIVSYMSQHLHSILHLSSCEAQKQIMLGYSFTREDLPDITQINLTLFQLKVHLKRKKEVKNINLLPHLYSVSV